MDVVPIVRGEFLYRDVLLVDCGGDLKRHPRASEAEIKHLLNGKGRDQVGHWWEAQLIHYGLQRSKLKDTCKVRLQQAMAQGKLKAQPPHLAEMEAQMKKEYSAAVRKAKAAGQTSTVMSTKKSAKRAREEEAEQSSKGNRITAVVGQASVDIEKSTFITQKGPTSSVTKAASTKATAASRAKSGSVPKVKHFIESKGDPRDHPDNVFQGSSASSGLDRKGSRARSKKAEPEAESPVESAVSRPRPKKARSKAAENEGSAVKQDAAYFEDADPMDMRPDISQDQLNITGVYNLSCPQLALQAPDHKTKFRLFMCVDNEGGRIWGAFELAWKSGHIKVDDIAYDMPLTLTWRARDFESNGSLSFGKGCLGDIEFFGHEQVRGTLVNLFPEPIQFQGERRPGPLWCGRSAYKFQQEWDEYPKEAYGR